MKKELNLQSPYNYSYDKATNSHIFITKNNILYRIAIIKDETLNTATISDDFDNLYQIIIEKISSELEAFDARVSKTIDHIITDFFSVQINALLYVCADIDDKGNIRFRTFDRWYKKSSAKDYINKIDNVISYAIEGNLEKLHSSLLYHKENALKDELIKAYKSLEQLLNEGK